MNNLSLKPGKDGPGKSKYSKFIWITSSLASLSILPFILLVSKSSIFEPRTNLRYSSRPRVIAPAEFREYKLAKVATLDQLRKSTQSPTQRPRSSGPSNVLTFDHESKQNPKSLISPRKQERLESYTTVTPTITELPTQTEAIATTKSTVSEDTKTDAQDSVLETTTIEFPSNNETTIFTTQKTWFDINQDIFDPSNNKNFWYSQEIQKFGRNYEDSQGHGLQLSPHWIEPEHELYYSYRDLDPQYVYDQESHAKIMSDSDLKFSDLEINRGFEDDMWVVGDISVNSLSRFETCECFNIRSAKSSDCEIIPPPSSQSFERSTIEAEMDTDFSQLSCPESYQILIMVKTAITHFAIREAIRKGWQLDLKHYDNKIGVYFLVGHSTNSSIEEYLRNEQTKYGDILMAKLEDSYDQVTLKVVMGMQFVYNYCSKAEYVVHLDDDTYFSPIRFMKIIYPKIEQQIKNPDAIIEGYTNQVHCSSWYHFSKPIRRNDAIWTVGLEQWGTDEYPNYCSGMGWGMAIKVHRRTFELTRKIDFSKIYNLDDLILTGIIRAQNLFGLAAYSGIMWHENNRKSHTEDKLYARYVWGKYQDPEHQWRRK